MSTLTSSTTFTIGSGSAVVESVTVPILPAAASPGGKGRLIHPTLGTLDYDYAPDEWVNIDADVIIAPIWASSKTLLGVANALWQGNIRDVEVQEIWNQPLNIRPAFMRQLLAFWQTPPDPDTDTPVQWWPNYTSPLGFNVAIVEVLVEGDKHSGLGISLTPDVIFRNWVAGSGVTIRMRILSRVS